MPPTMGMRSTAGPPTRSAEIPATTWSICRGCRALVYVPRLTRGLGVCPECGRHQPLGAMERLAQLADVGSIVPLAGSGPVGDPLGFDDTRPYHWRLDEARTRTGLDEAVVCVQATIDDNPAIVAVMDFRFMGGSLGVAVGEMITQAAETSLRERIPFIIVAASGGARMQEGALALMQMAKTSQALGQLDDAGILTVAVVTDPTYGGVAASFVTLCDIIVAEPGARLGFAGPRVIAQTIRQVLPPGFQTAEFLLEHGMIDLISPRHALRPTLGRLLSLGTRRGDGTWGAGPEPADDPAVTDPRHLREPDAWEAVQAARALDRPTTLDYIRLLMTEFEELHGDRLAADCPAIVGGLGRLAGMPVIIVGHQKGHDAPELVRRRFGMPTPSGYRKSARLMRLAAKLGLPVVTLIDTPGAYPGMEAERAGQAVAIADNLRLMSGLPVPVVAVVTGEGGSGGALALGVANRVLICENGVYSVISPEGCAAILWNSGRAAPEAAAALGLDARRLLGDGVVDAVIPEPPGGMRIDHHDAAHRVGAALVASLRTLAGLSPAELIDQRRERFRRFGVGASVDLGTLPARRDTPASLPVQAGTRTMPASWPEPLWTGSAGAGPGGSR